MYVNKKIICCDELREFVEVSKRVSGSYGDGDDESSFHFTMDDMVKIEQDEKVVSGEHMVLSVTDGLNSPRLVFRFCNFCGAEQT